MTGVQSVDWGLLVPLLGPAVAAVLILVLDAVLPRGLLAHRGRMILDLVAGAGLLVAIVALIPLAGDERATFCADPTHGGAVGGPGAVGGCSYAVEPITTGLQLVILLAAGVCLLLAVGSSSQPPRAEHHLLLLTATAGAVAVAGARDLATVVVALETASLPAVGLVALRRDGRGAEAGLKLLLTSVVSVAVLVMGIAILYAASGTLYLGPIGSPASPLLAAGHDARPLAGLGLALVIAGAAFKLSAVPFQLWTPDTYAGAPLPIAAFLAAVSKAAGLGALVVVLAAGAPLLAGTWVPLVGGLAILTMTVGNLVALRQDGAVRLLAWSTVAQAGWVILPLAGSGRAGRTSGPAVGASIAYLAAYILASLLAFAVVAILSREQPEGERHRLTAYAGLARRRPWLAGALAFALLALAGLPPGVVGLVAKVLALRPVVAEGSWFVVAVAVANVALGIAVYLRWGIQLIASPPPPGAYRADLPLPVAPLPGGPLSGAPLSGAPVGVAAAPTHLSARARASRPEIAALVLAAAAAVLLSVAPELLATLSNGLGG